MDEADSLIELMRREVAVLQHINALFFDHAKSYELVYKSFDEFGPELQAFVRATPAVRRYVRFVLGFNFGIYIKHTIKIKWLNILRCQDMFTHTFVFEWS